MPISPFSSQYYNNFLLNIQYSTTNATIITHKAMSDKI